MHHADCKNENERVEPYSYQITGNFCCIKKYYKYKSARNKYYTFIIIKRREEQTSLFFVINLWSRLYNNVGVTSGRPYN